MRRAAAHAAPGAAPGGTHVNGSVPSWPPAEASPPLYGHLLDFVGLLQASYDDPRAPPDAGRPLIEDGLHYGCQWKQWHPSPELPGTYNEASAVGPRMGHV